MRNLELAKQRAAVSKPDDVRRNGLTGNSGVLPIEFVTNASMTQRSALGAKLAPANAQFADYAVELEVHCDECGGSGYDPGGIDPWGPELCPKCHGAKTQTITRNYLAEAFRIAANPDNLRPVERLHLVAIIQHCRQVVSALMSLPEVPEHAESSSLGRAATSRRRRHQPRWKGATARYQPRKEKI